MGTCPMAAGGSTPHTPQQPHTAGPAECQLARDRQRCIDEHSAVTCSPGGGGQREGREGLGVRTPHTDARQSPPMAAHRGQSPQLQNEKNYDRKTAAHFGMPVSDRLVDSTGQIPKRYKPKF